MYAKQYSISKDKSRIPTAYRYAEFRDWCIGVAPDLEILPLEISGAVAGYLIGHFHHGALPQNTETYAAFENWLYDTIGSYVALVNLEGGARLYLDPCGSLPAVYASDAKTIAANPDLINDMPYDEALKKHAAIGDFFFPFGLTPKPNVSRLLPNHYLCLDNFTTCRHETIYSPTQTGSENESIEIIADHLAHNIDLTNRRYDCVLPLTAGRDSRTLLACSGAHKKSMSYFTSMIDDAARWDARVAHKIADTYSLNHANLEYDPPNEQERSLWLASTGYCVGGRASYNFKTIAVATKGKAVLMGLSGEAGRAYYGAGVQHDTKIDGNFLLKKLGFQQHKFLLPSAVKWLEGLSGLNAQQIMDLFYIEIRLGCWAGPQMVAMGPALTRVLPYNHRAIFKEVQKIPYQKRKQEWIPDSIVRLKAPELCRIAYKKPDPAMKLKKFVKRLLKRA